MPMLGSEPLAEQGRHHSMLHVCMCAHLDQGQEGVGTGPGCWQGATEVVALQVHKLQALEQVGTSPHLRQGACKQGQSSA